MRGIVNLSGSGRERLVGERRRKPGETVAGIARDAATKSNPLPGDLPAVNRARPAMTWKAVLCGCKLCKSGDIRHGPRIPFETRALARSLRALAVQRNKSPADARRDETSAKPSQLLAHCLAALYCIAQS
jgi:hypothetical protein